jgi:hypothetical protein
LDTASSASLINASFARELQAKNPVEANIVYKAHGSFSTADGSCFTTNLKLELLINIGNTRLTNSFHLVENLPAALLLGVDSLIQLNAVIDVAHNVCYIRKNPIPMMVTNRDQYLFATNTEVVEPLSSKLVCVAAPASDFEVENIEGTPLLVGHGIVPKEAKEHVVLVVNTSNMNYTIHPGDIIAQRAPNSEEIVCFSAPLKHTDPAGGLDVLLQDKELHKRLTKQ